MNYFLLFYHYKPLTQLTTSFRMKRFISTNLKTRCAKKQKTSNVPNNPYNYAISATNEFMGDIKNYLVLEAIQVIALHKQTNVSPDNTIVIDTHRIKHLIRTVLQTSMLYINAGTLPNADCYLTIMLPTTHYDYIAKFLTNKERSLTKATCHEINNAMTLVKPPPIDMASLARHWFADRHSVSTYSQLS